MNKIILYNRRYNNLPTDFVKGEQVKSVDIDVVKPDRQLLDYIFSVNPLTGMPQGDIAIFMSDKTDNEVKNYIQSQLFVEQPSDPGIITDDSVLRGFQSEITDDDIARFTRNHGETREEYADRVKQYIDEVRYNNRMRAETLKFESERKKNESSDKSA